MTREDQCSFLNHTCPPSPQSSDMGGRECKMKFTVAMWRVPRLQVYMGSPTMVLKKSDNSANQGGGLFRSDWDGPWIMPQKKGLQPLSLEKKESKEDSIRSSYVLRCLFSVETW